MTNYRFWKIVDKYTKAVDHADGIEQTIENKDDAMIEITYYDHGFHTNSVDDYCLLVGDNMEDGEYKEAVSSLEQLCKEYTVLGAKEYRKKYKKVFTNY